MKLAQLAFAALLGATLSAPVLVQPPQGMGPGMGPGGGMGGMGPGARGMRYQFNQDNTFGWSLMTPEERTAHHNAMMSAKTYEECKAAQEAQHKQMETRAREQGKTLPAPRQNACDRMKARGFYK